MELRKRLLAIQINGLPVGDLIYDTYVRETRRITIRAFDDDLKAYLILLVNYCTLYERLLGALDVGAVVWTYGVFALWRSRAYGGKGGKFRLYKFGGKGMRIQRREGLDKVMDVIFRVQPDDVCADDR